MVPWSELSWFVDLGSMIHTCIIMYHTLLCDTIYIYMYYNIKWWLYTNSSQRHHLLRQLRDKPITVHSPLSTYACMCSFFLVQIKYIHAPKSIYVKNQINICEHLRCIIIYPNYIIFLCIYIYIYL